MDELKELTESIDAHTKKIYKRLRQKSNTVAELEDNTDKLIQSVRWKDRNMAELLKNKLEPLLRKEKAIHLIDKSPQVTNASQP